MAGKAAGKRASETPAAQERVPVRAVERAGRILEVLLSAPLEGLGLAEIAERAGLHKTTTLRLLRSLSGIRVVRRLSGSDRYAWDALHWLGVAARLREAVARAGAVQTAIDRLAAASGESIALAYPDVARGRALFAAMAASQHALRVDPAETRSWPLHASAPGKICLAYMSEADARAYAARGLAPLTPRTITSAAKLAAELSKVRSQGHALSWEEGVPGAATVAVPVREDTGSVVGALGLAAPVQRATQGAVQQWLQLLRDGSRDLTKLLYLAPISGADTATFAGGPPPQQAPPQRPRKPYRLV
ncbi:MAG: IclR family transcriptional regulator [Armatimonadota bacterium]